MKSANVEHAAGSDPNEQLSWLWPESTDDTMAGLYAHPSFVANSAILSLPSSSSKESTREREREKEGSVGDRYGSGSSSSTLTTTLSNTSHISMQSSGSMGSSNGFSKYSIADPHPGTLVALDSPIGSPTGTRKTSVFSTTSKSTTSPFRMYQGRRYHSDESILYILPCDIPELTRQGLKHLLFKEVFGGIHMADFSDPQKIPSKVLDIGCSTGLWISNMHDEFAALGRDNVKFVGMDIVPIHAPMPEVDFTFVKHDLLRFPYSFKDGEFDYVFVRDMTLSIPDNAKIPEFVTEVMRVLRDGGIFEVQCTDHTIRSLLETKAIRNPGSSAYTINSTTQFATSKNAYIQAYNNRLTKILTERKLSPMPCTLVGASLLMEDGLTDIHSVRLALPLDEISWESSPSRETSSPVESGREGYYDLKRKNSVSAKAALQQPSVLPEEEKAVRYMARLQLTQFMESLEPYLKEASDCTTDDYRPKDMMNNFFRDGGLRDGECMEFGAWWSTKRGSHGG